MRKRVNEYVKHLATDNHGSGYIYTVVLIMVVVIVILAVKEYNLIFGTVEACKKIVRERTEAYLTEYSIMHYSDLKKGIGGRVLVNISEVTDGVLDALNVNKEDKKTQLMVGDGVLKLEDISVTATRTEPITVEVIGKISLTSKMMGGDDFNYHLPVKVRCRLVSKY